jgi:hypothetical protein
MPHHPEALESLDKLVGAISYLSSLALLALGVYGFYQAYIGWDVTAESHDWSLFLAVTGLLLVLGALINFLAEMRIPAVRRNLLVGCSFTWSRQGRGWFFLLLGLFALFLPYDSNTSWSTKAVGALQLLSGFLLCSLAYIGGMREDLYSPSVGLASPAGVEEAGGVQEAGTSAGGGGETWGATPLRPASSVVVVSNPFLNAQPQ